MAYQRTIIKKFIKWDKEKPTGIAEVNVEILDDLISSQSFGISISKADWDALPLPKKDSLIPYLKNRIKQCHDHMVINSGVKPLPVKEETLNFTLPKEII